MVSSEKLYVVFAGVNGSGKSTLYHMQNNFKDMPRVNVDEIVRETGDWKNPDDQIKGARVAIRKQNEYFKRGLSFNRETTLCGLSIIKSFKTAKELGYKIIVYFIGVDSTELCIERIQQRVKQGGHDIPDEDVRRRYEECFRNIRYLQPFCDKIYYFDNTKRMKLIATYINRHIAIFEPELPVWFLKNFKEDI